MPEHRLVPPFDRAALAAMRTGLPRDAFDDVLRTFATSVGHNCAALQAALRDRDRRSLRSLGHGIAGSAATFCAAPLAAVALELQNCALAGRWDDVEAAAGRLLTEAERVTAAVAGWSQPSGEAQ